MEQYLCCGGVLMVKMKGVNCSEKIVSSTEEVFNHITKDCEEKVKHSIDWLIFNSRRVNFYTEMVLANNKSEKPSYMKYVVFFKDTKGFTGNIKAYLDMRNNSVVTVGSFKDGEIFVSGVEDIKDLEEAESKYEKIFEDLQENGELKQYGCSFTYDVEA